MTVNEMRFSFSDRFSGYLAGFDEAAGQFLLRTSDGSQFQFALTDTTYGKVIRNADEQYIDCTGRLREILADDGQYISVYGIAYPQGESFRLNAKEITVFEDPHRPGKRRFETSSWWQDQIRAFGNFQLRAQFDDDDQYDFANYKTQVSKVGSRHRRDTWQEIDTLSRYIYGIATTFMLTGDYKFLKAAREGVIYQRKHMRIRSNDGRYVYWYHAVMENHADHKIVPSRFGDDYGTIAMYEQIYALAGLTQYFRITNDAEVLDDIEKTIAFMNRYFRDDSHFRGYFSHIDPVTFSPREETLGQNRAKKNWNSVGDHAPAYLENLYLGTGKEEYRDMLRYVADLILQHFQDYERSPFVQEKFLEDWSHDYHWGWQQNRGVVGHNLKIAWCMCRLYHIFGSKDFLEFAETAASIIPSVGYDHIRGGWYDVIERAKPAGQDMYDFTWHNRKAWWQQEQALLAYMVLYGTTGRPDYLKLARETAAFWNLAFLDHDDGESYFAVLADGTAYLVGTESMKGSHSKGAYHSFELCYFAHLYNNLLHMGEPVSLYFMPKNYIPVTERPSQRNSRCEFRVQPISFPAGRVSILSVEIDGQPHGDFSSEDMIVYLPNRDDDFVLKVTLGKSS